MPILSSVGRKSWATRALVLGIYGLLTLGGILMVVPLLLTLTMAVSNQADLQRGDLLPAYWWREDLRVAKYLAEKYDDLRFEYFASAWEIPDSWTSFKDLGLARQWPLRLARLQRRPAEELQRIAADYGEFLAAYRIDNTLPLFATWDRSVAQDFIRRRYEHKHRAAASDSQALRELSRRWNEGIIQAWDQIEFYRERHYPYHLKRWVPPADARQDDYAAYVASLPAGHKMPVSQRYLWSVFLQDRGLDIDRIDRQHGTDFQSFYRVPRGDAQTLPPPLARQWEQFLTQAWPRRLDRSAEGEYQAFLEKKYGTLAALNAAYGWSADRFSAVDLPLAEIDYQDYRSHRGRYFCRLVLGNFAVILDYIAGRGGALWNTFFLVSLSVAATLLVNPLAAYALSRFPMRWAPQILMFLTATMLFPAEVGMIPSFLLLRDLHLLNTFAALILPTVANGFSILLLKGFFDSLPRELYEAAALDGAGEWTIFRRITLPLCQPILAVIAMNAFLATYGSFMWAFLVAQDPGHWTLMVWLYQYQQNHADQPHLIFAALVLASLPTLAVFLLCQRVLLRGTLYLK